MNPRDIRRQPRMSTLWFVFAILGAIAAPVPCHAIGAEARTETYRPAESATADSQTHDNLHRNYPLLPRVKIRGPDIDLSLGSEYSRTLMASAAERYRDVADGLVDTSRLLILSLADNSNTEQAIQRSNLRRISIDVRSDDKASLLRRISITRNQVIIIIGHIDESGTLRSGKAAVPVSELYETAKVAGIPLVVVGCESVKFGPTGYDTDINSLQIVTSLAGALKPIMTYRELLSAIAGSYTLILDWKSLRDMHGLLRVVGVDDKGDEHVTIYLGGLNATALPVPQPTGVAAWAIDHAIAFWKFCAAVTFFSLCGALFALSYFMDSVVKAIFQVIGGITLACVGILIAGLVGFAVAGLITQWVGLIVFVVLFVTLVGFENEMGLLLRNEQIVARLGGYIGIAIISLMIARNWMA